MGKCNGCGESVKYPAKRCPHCGKKMIYPGVGIAVLCIGILLVFFIPYSLGLFSRPADKPVSSGAQPAQNPATVTPGSVESDSAFGPGTYVVGKDIDAGTYDCVAVSGIGVLRGDVAAFGEQGFVQTMGSVSASVGEDAVSIDGVESYSNLTLTDGDVIYIELSLKVEFVPK